MPQIIEVGVCIKIGVGSGPCRRSPAPISPHPPNPLRSGSSFPQPIMAASRRLRSQILPSASFDRSQCDRDDHEDQKDGSNIAHRRARSAQCTSATPNAIAIHGAIIFASSPVKMTGGITLAAMMPPSVPHAGVYVSRTARISSAPLAGVLARSLAHVCQIVVRRCQRSR
jgi:hypothetical protein